MAHQHDVQCGLRTLTLVATNGEINPPARLPSRISVRPLQLRPSHLPILLRPLPQNLPLDLARRALGHLVHKDHPARQVLMLRDLALHPLLDFFRTRRAFRLEQHVRPGVFLGAEGVLQADDAHVVNGRVGEEDSLELGRSNLETGDFDEFLLGKVSASLRIHCWEDVPPSVDPQCRTTPSHH